MSWQDAVARFAEKRPRPARALAFANGALLVFSFAPFGWHALLAPLLLPFILLTQCVPPGIAARLGYYFGAGLFLAGTYWLYISVHVFGEAPLVIAIVLMIALVLLMACYYAGAGWLISRYGAGNPARLIVVAPAVWVLLEWLRGWFLSGFPWMSVGYAQIDSPLAAFAPVAGVYGVSLAVLFTVAAFASAVLAQGKMRGVYGTLVLLPWVVGFAAGQIDWTESSGSAVRATIVQGGISQDRKWLPEQFPATLKLYRDSLAVHSDSDLVVWPEVAIPSVVDQVEGYISELQREVAERNQVLMFGILERDLAVGKIYNSVVTLDGSSRQIYRKRHLVPFGEYFPVPSFVREWMRLMSLPHSDLSPGIERPPLIELPDGNRLSVAICYEDAYGAEQLYAFPGTTILINVSNDAWFGDSIAPHQHLEIARMRALEVGRYVVRATNNGVSAFIGPHGELLQEGPQFEKVLMTADVSPRRGLTPYARTGNLPVILLACVGLAFVVAFAIRRKES